MVLRRKEIPFSRWLILLSLVFLSPPSSTPILRLRLPWRSFLLRLTERHGPSQNTLVTRMCYFSYGAYTKGYARLSPGAKSKDFAENFHVNRTFSIKGEFTRVGTGFAVLY